MRNWNGVARSDREGKVRHWLGRMYKNRINMGDNGEVGIRDDI